MHTAVLTLLLNLIMTIKKTNKTSYLKPNHLPTVIIDKAIRRSIYTHSSPSVIFEMCYPTVLLCKRITKKQKDKVC